MLLNAGAEIEVQQEDGMTALHLARLQGLCLSVQAGENANAAVKSARPPIFFRRQASIVRQLQIWQMSQLESAEQTVQSAISQTRQLPALETELAERALLSLARNAQVNRLRNF